MYIDSITIVHVCGNPTIIAFSIQLCDSIVLFISPPLQIFLVADVMYSFLVHQYDLKHGLPRLDQLGKPVKLKLY